MKERFQGSHGAILVDFTTWYFLGSGCERQSKIETFWYEGSACMAGVGNWWTTWDSDKTHARTVRHGNSGVLRARVPVGWLGSYEIEVIPLTSGL